jgi:hypothetical protein
LGSVGGPASDWIITVVIGGAILTEVGVQLTTPAAARPRTGAPAPIDELDGTGPIYDRDDPLTPPPKEGPR